MWSWFRSACWRCWRTRGEAYSCGFRVRCMVSWSIIVYRIEHSVNDCMPKGQILLSWWHKASTNLSKYSRPCVELEAREGGSINDDLQINKQIEHWAQCAPRHYRCITLNCQVTLHSSWSIWVSHTRVLAINIAQYILVHFSPLPISICNVTCCGIVSEFQMQKLGLCEVMRLVETPDDVRNE